jgi:hypothetical protein
MAHQTGKEVEPGPREQPARGSGTVEKTSPTLPRRMAHLQDNSRSPGRENWEEMIRQCRYRA